LICNVQVCVKEEQLVCASGLQYPNYRDDTPCQFSVILIKKHTVTHFLICAILCWKIEHFVFKIQIKLISLSRRESVYHRERERERQENILWMRCV
jgi:hypothetical protein